jgi:hypothetical protein
MSALLRQLFDNSAISFGDSRIPARIWDKLFIDPNGCWIWRGALTLPYPKGYPIAFHRWVNSRTKKRLVHIWLYETFKGKYRSGLDLDHLCRVRCCCNPDHLEPVTRLENILRGDLPKDFCKYGHPRIRGSNEHCAECNRQLARWFRRTGLSSGCPIKKQGALDAA